MTRINADTKLMAKTLNSNGVMFVKPAAENPVDVHPITAEILKKQDELLALVRGLSEMARHPARELRPFNCTQEDFDKLPGLVSRATFLYWTGLSPEELTKETTERHIAVYKPRENGKALYFKYEIARLTKFKL
jgi:hypothetical protein